MTLAAVPVATTTLRHPGEGRGPVIEYHRVSARCLGAGLRRHDGVMVSADYKHDGVMVAVSVVVS